MLLRKLAPFVISLAVAATSSVARAEGSVDERLSEAENAYAAVDYGVALTKAEEVLSRSELTHDALKRATRVAALSHAALGHTAESKAQFVKLLAFDPSFTLDKKLGPRFAEPYQEARGFWQAQSQKPGLSVDADVSWGHPGQLRVSLRDPLNLVRSVIVAHRFGQGDFELAKLAEGQRAAPVRATEERSARLEYWAKAVDDRGNAVFEDGSPEQPKSLVLVQPAASRDERGRGVFASPVFWVVGGVVLAGAAAAGGYFAFRPTEYTPSTTTRAAFTLNCGSARCE